ncbi:MAG TPA: protein kinase [Planctomycetaceae bacterium]|nr:protein kinase [Planctomycetaceae bacterium]
MESGENSTDVSPPASESGSLRLDETFKVDLTSGIAKFPTIPGYEVEELIGRGGMGAVYRARNLKLNRAVAVKMILARGGASTEELIRFQIEAESLATLQHANIVQIHEVGETDEGPFLALEYVEGESLEQALRKRVMPLEEAVSLVEDLAKAIHAAHQRGIVHRDLKPGNILLSQDGTPKITDFGLAKRLTEDSNVTQPGLVVGTPSYMAPEQSRGESRAVGPSSDIYALGAILWKLMTGEPPFTGNSIIEVLDQVRTAQPVLSKELKRKVPRDLETICLKCLEKDPQRRYLSAESLREDLRRFRAREPILARPSSLAERIGKWIRRKPAIATLCLLLAIVLIGSAVGGILYNIKLRIALDRAEQNFQLASQAVEEMLEEFTSEESALVPHMEQKRRVVLTKALQFAISLSEDKPEDAVAKRRVGYALRRVGDIQRMLGNPEASRDAYRQSIDLLEELHREEPSDHEIQIQLANAKNFLGELLRSTGRADEARQNYEQALQTQKEVAKTFPDLAGVQTDLARTNYNLGILLKDLNQLDQASEHLEESIQSLSRLVTAFPDERKYAHHLARAQLNLGPVRRLQNRPQDAFRAYELALVEFRKLLQQDPYSPGYQYESAVAYSNLGNLFASQGERSQAVDNYRQAHAVFAELTKLFPTLPVYRVESANTLNSQGAVLAASGDFPGAIQTWQSSVESLRSLIEINPDVPAYHGDLGMTLGNLGRVYLKTDDLTAAQKSLERGIDSLVLSLNSSPEHPVYRSALRKECRDLSFVFVHRLSFDELLTLSNKLRETVSDSGLGLLMSLHILARSLEELKKLEEIPEEVRAFQRTQILERARFHASELISHTVPELQDLRENRDFAVLREDPTISDLLNSLTPPR